MLGYIYAIKNTVNNKIYIGQTRGLLKNRFFTHRGAARDISRRSKLYTAMRELGIDNFYIEEICKCEYNELNDKEKYYIRFYNTIENGYNSLKGGSYNSKYCEMTDEIEGLVVRLYTEFRGSFASIQNYTGMSQYLISIILYSHGIDTNKSFEHMKEIDKTKVYGVHRKAGQIVEFKNAYVAAQALYDEGLTTQDKLYVRNDIERSIKSEDRPYGIGSYLWFRDIAKAKEKSAEVIAKHDISRYDITQRGPFISIKMKKKQTVPCNQRNMTYLGAKVNVDIPNEFDTLREHGNDPKYLMELLKHYSVNKIAAYYSVSFTTMKRRLANLGLPYTKDEIAAYRKRANTDVT